MVFLHVLTEYAPFPCIWIEIAAVQNIKPLERFQTMRVFILPFAQNDGAVHWAVWTVVHLNGDANAESADVFLIKLADHVSFQLESVLMVIIDLPVEFIRCVPYVDPVLAQDIIPHIPVFGIDVPYNEAFPWCRVQLTHRCLKAYIA
jgi:hypothetical protein